MIRLTVNGNEHSLDLDPSMPLLWAIRDHIGLTGTKYGCGIAQCGSCTVYLNGAPVRACATPLSAAAGGKVTTIEGLDSPRGGRSSRPGRSWTWSSAASASLDKSCPQRPCSRITRSPRTRISMPPCPATSAAVPPTPVSALRSNGRPSNWSEEGKTMRTDQIENLSRRDFLESIGWTGHRGRSDPGASLAARSREGIPRLDPASPAAQSAPTRPSSRTPSCASARTTP